MPDQDYRNPTTRRMAQELEDLDNEIKKLKDNPPAQDKEGDIDPSKLEAYNKRLNSLEDDRRALIVKVNEAERLDRKESEEKAKEATRRTAAEKRRAESGNKGWVYDPSKSREENANNFISDLEDKQALGEIGKDEAERRYKTFEYQYYTLPREQEQDKRAKEQAEAQKANQTADNRRADEQLGLNRRSTERLEAQADRSQSSTEANTRIAQQTYARQTAKDAVDRARDAQDANRRAAFARGVAGGASAQDALKGAYADPDLDIEAIADRGARRALQDIGVIPRDTPATAAAGSGPPNTVNAPAGSTPANPLPAGSSGNPALAAAKLGGAQAAGTMAPPPALNPYRDQDTALGRFGR